MLKNFALWTATFACALALTPAAAADPLQDGFNAMYNLEFDVAHRIFQQWEQTHPTDPRGPAFDAAAYLFSEFDRLRILQSHFFLDDRSFSGRRTAVPDSKLKGNFDRALARSKALADARLRESPHDKDALFATVMRFGLQADYDALIAKDNLKALGETKQGREVAEDLLARDPTYYDAYIAEGVENYLLSQKPAPVRWFLNLTGAQTNEQTGIAKLKLTAAKGKYLQPYAELLLAVAALRGKNKAEAKSLLADLAGRFPGNRLYREELAKLK